MSVKSYKVILRREKKNLAAVTLVRGCEPVLIGRARDCALRIPTDDYSASSVHAKVSWRGASLVIEDAGSRNGIYFEGKLLKGARKMRPGDFFAVGNCLVLVELEKRDRGRKGLAYHRLECLNGESAGKIYDIKPRGEGRDFDIGLDPQASVHLNDLLVSRRHAVLRTHDDGECWIEDTGSRNGTFVNGERLSGKERLLKDGDKISVAFFEFRFLDRNVAHTRLQAWFKLAAVSVTLCVMGGLYIAYTATRQSTENYLATARREAAAEKFDVARAAGEDAWNARDAGDYREQIDALLAQIEKWEKTCRAWKEVREDFAARRLSNARRTLDDLLAASVDAWAWNPSEASNIRRDAEFAAKALRLYFDGKDAIAAAGTETQLNADLKVRSAIGPIESFLREQGAFARERPYLAEVLKLMDKLQDDLRFIRRGYDAVDAGIAHISPKNPDFRGAYESFGKIAADEKLPAAVRGYARQQLVPCKAFVEAQEFLAGEFVGLQKLDFEGVRKASSDFKLPSPEICIRQTRYSDARAVFSAKHEDYLHEASALQMMVDSLRDAGITLESRGETIDLFLNVTNLNDALSFDCLQHRPPNARRPEPVGHYDELFGVEHVYEALRSLPRTASQRNLRSVGFTPKCVSARQAFDRAETFVQYLDADDKKYLQRGDLGRYYMQCVRITLERERMVQRLKDMKGTARLEIVAGYFADYFSPRPTDVAKRALSIRFANLKREMMDLGEKYQFETDPTKQLKIRDQILATGIPGDPVMHSKWAQKFD